MTTPDDRDEMIVELLSAILTRLDGMKNDLGVATKPNETTTPDVLEKFASMGAILRKLTTHTAAIEKRMQEIDDVSSPARRHAEDEVRRLGEERRLLLGEILRLDRVWYWLVPLVVLLTTITVVIGIRLTLGTEIGCSLFGGNYLPAIAGRDSTCGFIGRWW